MRPRERHEERILLRTHTGTGRNHWNHPFSSHWRANKSWFEYQLTLASTFTEQVGLSISNIRLRELLKNQSIKDPLTGVFNRRYLGEFLERETRRVTRAKQLLGVIMLDLDHFKKFNDTYGHGAGDKVLQELGLTLVKSVRAEDVVCRYGGEECATG